MAEGWRGNTLCRRVYEGGGLRHPSLRPGGVRVIQRPLWSRARLPRAAAHRADRGAGPGLPGGLLVRQRQGGRRGAGGPGRRGHPRWWRCARRGTTTWTSWPRRGWASAWCACPSTRPTPSPSTRWRWCSRSTARSTAPTPGCASGTSPSTGWSASTCTARPSGVVGTGRIGRVAARIFHGFGCRVLGSTRCRTPRRAELRRHATCPWTTLYRDADIVSLHVPLTPGDPPPDRRGGARAMKPGVDADQHGPRGAHRQPGAASRRSRRGHLGAAGSTSTRRRRASSSRTCRTRCSRTTCSRGCSPSRTCWSPRTRPSSPARRSAHRPHHAAKPPPSSGGSRWRTKCEGRETFSRPGAIVLWRGRLNRVEEVSFPQALGPIFAAHHPVLYATNFSDAAAAHMMPPRSLPGGPGPRCGSSTCSPGLSRRPSASR